MCEFIHLLHASRNRVHISNRDIGPRDLSQLLDVAGGVTAESCPAACKSAGYSLAGLEYGKECCKFIRSQFSCVPLSHGALN
jgi:hypothetical protein